MERPDQITGVYIESRIINLVSYMIALGEESPGRGFLRGTSIQKMGHEILGVTILNGWNSN